MNYRTHLIKWNYLLNKMTSKTEKKKTLKKRKKKYTNLIVYRLSALRKKNIMYGKKKNLFLLHMIYEMLDEVNTIDTDRNYMKNI